MLPCLLSIIWERNFSNPEICFENFRVGFSGFPSFVIDSSSNGVKMVVESCKMLMIVAELPLTAV